ncbi:MAG: hypothetical protein JKY09_06745 [Crocinitomicaceae bacterium]|nr:hypothetical protein [Crocinitomicaceae bacterium]
MYVRLKKEISKNVAALATKVTTCKDNKTVYKFPVITSTHKGALHSVQGDDYEFVYKSLYESCEMFNQHLHKSKGGEHHLRARLVLYNDHCGFPKSHISVFHSDHEEYAMDQEYHRDYYDRLKGFLAACKEKYRPELVAAYSNQKLVLDHNIGKDEMTYRTLDIRFMSPTWFEDPYPICIEDKPSTLSEWMKTAKICEVNGIGVYRLNSCWCMFRDLTNGKWFKINGETLIFDPYHPTFKIGDPQSL